MREVCWQAHGGDTRDIAGDTTQSQTLPTWSPKFSTSWIRRSKNAQVSSRPGEVSVSMNNSEREEREENPRCAVRTAGTAGGDRGHAAHNSHTTEARTYQCWRTLPEANLGGSTNACPSNDHRPSTKSHPPPYRGETPSPQRLEGVPPLPWPVATRLATALCT